MFTWICPQCGREVPPSYTECPDCAKNAAQPAAAVPVAAPPQAAPPYPPQSAPPPYQPPAPPYQPPYQPPQAAPPYQPPAPPPAEPPQAAPYHHVHVATSPLFANPTQTQVPAYSPPGMPGTRGPLPTWLMTVLFALAFFGLVAGVYWIVGASRGTSAKPVAAVESPAAKPSASTSPYQKYIEISGVRFLENKKATETRFVIINHSNADIVSLGGNVTVWGRTRNSEEDAAGTFTFKTDLKAYESKELSAPLNTKLKIYELPDWQNVSTDVQITAP